EAVEADCEALGAQEEEIVIGVEADPLMRGPRAFGVGDERPQILGRDAQAGLLEHLADGGLGEGLALIDGPADGEVVVDVLPDQSGSEEQQSAIVLVDYEDSRGTTVGEAVRGVRHGASLSGYAR